MKANKIGAFLGIICANLLVVGYIIYQNNQPTPISRSVLSTQDNFINVDYKAFRLTPEELKTMKKIDLFNDLTEIADERTGTFGIYVKEISTERVFAYNPNEVFYGASLYKVPIAVATPKMLAEKNLTYQDKLTYWNVDFYGGTGFIQTNLNKQTEYTYEELVTYLLKNSDNIAQNMLVRSISSTTLRRTYESLSPLQNKSKFYDVNETTPYEMAEIMEAVFLNEIDQKPEYSVIDNMKDTAFDNRIHAGLSPTTEFSHKIGNYGSTWHDCGIAFVESPVAVCVMSKDTTFSQFLEISRLTGIFIEAL